MIREIPKSFSKYHILKKLGEGAMGEVYLAEDKELNRKVALKFLSRQLDLKPEVVKRFIREAQAAAALDHPNIITIYEIAKHEGSYFIAMQYVKGISLREFIETSQRGLHKFSNYAIQICKGLGWAHKHEILHRDIKPENIMIAVQEDRVKIVDFGLAKLGGVSQLTQAGTIMGTLFYMSPEQISRKELDHRSDIFSVGVVLYELLTGKKPFPGESEAAVIYGIVNSTPPPLVNYNKDCPEKAQNIIDKALEKDVTNRYQTLDDLRADLIILRDELTEPTEFETELVEIDTGEKKKSVRLTLSLTVIVGLFFLAYFVIPAIVNKITSDGNMSSLVEPELSVISVLTKPPGADILVDGESIGSSPIEDYQVDEEKINLKIRQDNYLTIDTSFTVTPEEKLDIFFQLTPTAILSIAVNPSDAIIILDGDMINPQSFANLQIAAGDHSINVSRQGYQTIEEQISLVHRQQQRLSYQLQKEKATMSSPNPKPTPIATGSINLTSNPSGALIFVDDQPSGVTPQILENIESGRYTIAMRKSGYEDYQIPVTVQRDQTTDVSTKLIRFTGSISISSNPSGASIFVNDQPSGVTPQNLENIESGKYTVSLRKSGYDDYQTFITVQKDQITDVGTKLIRLTGMIKVLAIPYGSIFLDGDLKQADTEFQYSTTLPTGTHTLRVQHPTYGFWEKVLNIESDKTTDLTIDFSKKVKVTVAAEPAFGEIIVNNTPTGQYTPYELDLSIGTYTIEVRRQGYELIGGPKKITIEENFDGPIWFSLKKISQ